MSDRTFCLAPLSELHESKTNPRRHFDEKGLKELTESVRAKGVGTSSHRPSSPRTGITS